MAAGPLLASLHDLNYERYPDLETGHPRKALELFEERGYPRELIEAVAGHAPYLGVPRQTPLARALFAVDELTEFIAAVALVRPLRGGGRSRAAAPGGRGARRGLRRARRLRHRGARAAGGRARPEGMTEGVVGAPGLALPLSAWSRPAGRLGLMSRGGLKKCAVDPFSLPW